MSRTGPSKKGEASGFTFLELLVVLVILGLFGSLVSLRIQDVFTQGDLRLASRVVMGEVQRFRGKAAYTSEMQVMQMELGRNVLYPKEPADAGSASRSSEPDLGLGDEADRVVTVLPEGVFFEDVITRVEGKVQEGVAGVRFFADGTVQEAYIHLRNEKEAFYTLEINPLTGYVTIHDGYVEQEDQGP